MGRELGDRGAQAPASVLVPPQQAMDLQGRRQPVCGGSGQAGPFA